MCDQLPELQLEPGDALLQEGDRAGVFYFLISGEVEILKHGIQIDLVSEPGAVFGEMSFLLNSPHMATVRALTHSRFYRAENPSDFSRSHPDLYMHVSMLLARRLQSVTDHLVETRLQLKSETEHALRRRLSEALRRCLTTPAS
jgi:CRP-like cAMP-binding protein